MDLINFNQYNIDKTANYGGSDKKRGILIDEQRYMLKLSDHISDEKRNSLNSSYSNSAFSEYISCHIIETIGLPVQETLLGTIELKSRLGEQKIYPTVACKNFIKSNEELVEFKFIESTLLDKKPPKIPIITDIYEILTNENEYFDKDFAKISLERYWDTFIIDALLGNFDRHANNWGYLVNKDTNEISLAPIYDCGSCLYPQMSDEGIIKILNSKEELQMRIDKFPKPALELEDGNKASYKEYIASFTNPDCTAALMRITPKINIKKIENIIDNTPAISDIRKQFYKIMLKERYQQIILEPYKEHLRMLQQRTPKCFPKCSYCPENCIVFGNAGNLNFNDYKLKIDDDCKDLD